VVTSLVNEAYGPTQLDNPSLRRWKIRTVQAADAVTARRVRRFHAVSTTVATTMADRLRLPLDRIDVIPRGRDPRDLGVRSDARRTQAREGLGVAPNERLLLAVGRHEYQKGFDVLLHAFAAARDDEPALRLVIAGREGSDSTQLRELASALDIGDGVEFLGFRSDVPDLLCAADTFVSTSRWEGSPGGVIEAMALEVPIIAADIPAVREVFGDEDCGTVVPPDDVAALAHVLTVRDPASDARVQRARARFDACYRIDTVTREMVQFYERALAPCNARQATERARR
jgi:glycosyltransferase involved in cell wall biosynthesis